MLRIYGKEACLPSWLLAPSQRKARKKKKHLEGVQPWEVGKKCLEWTLTAGRGEGGGGWGPRLLVFFVSCRSARATSRALTLRACAHRFGLRLDKWYEGTIMSISTLANGQLRHTVKYRDK